MGGGEAASKKTQCILLTKSYQSMLAGTAVFTRVHRRITPF